ncbi:nuclear transport factor 2 family protein [Mycolicibacterium fluoranthenivorans]|jgi:limonene-1,2-epoxide hydrolase|uniref:Limonene-1,2-epoxide hydrolase n=1 Tax=Mycolicibacterium fluoranthenivorans TaxID=258505 RepID=A0A1G4W2S1_9MYCO|nr:MULTISPECIES: limonene-1,2-epoxide hydrolase family protein [Mycobacteriaceae]MCV7251278.1 nuclear transport factor 2 family protein [Mycobacterium hackensackense]QNJ95700.1 nuclear transport factor 2 family protein [Mycolicibacterium fluoranthenivorans]SCX15757.1 limonene-1,2-epoxide hydrolase [Mycolicibacterium fluoranthenivorans]
MTEQQVAAAHRAGADNIATVEAFLNALRAPDLDAAAELLDENLVYQNVGFPTIHGRRRAIKLFRAMERPSLGFDVLIHRSAADGASVLNERTDVLIFGPVRLQFWVCGVFEVHDGRITLWRDYFDQFDFAKAIVRGVLGAVIPALRPQLT